MSLLTTLLLLGAMTVEEAPLTVMTTFHPTTYFAQRIGGDAVKVICPLPEDADPAYWQPTREQIAEYQKTDLVVVNGANFEKWLEKSSLPESRLVVTTRSFKDSYIEIQDAVTHSHGKEGAHTHVGIDGHTWLDPINAKAQATAIAQAFQKKRPESAAKFDAHLAELVKDLDALDAQWKEVGKRFGTQCVVASHPAYNYVARRYGFQVFSLDFDPEEMPTAEQLAGLKTALQIRPATYILWEAPPTQEIERAVKEATGLKSLVVEPAENPGAQRLAKGEDFLAIQRANVERLLQTLDGKD